MATDKKTILITGASRGLGLATATYFSQQGWNVYGTSTTRKGLENLFAHCPNATGSVVDVRREGDVAAAVVDAVRQYPTVDVLMNNIGIPCRMPLSEITLEKFTDVMNVNVGSAFLFTKEMIPYLRSQGHGRIINVDSLAGLQPYGNSGIYVASKYAMTGFAKSVRHDVHADNIQVINIYPGGIKTDFHSTPRPEFMEARDVAEMIHFAATRPWNAYIPEMTITPSRDARLP